MTQYKPQDFTEQYVYPIKVILRFISKIRKSPSGCWEWTGSRTGSGNQYGKCHISPGKNALAHRLAWEVANNFKVPNGKIVMHKCDNPICVRPSHLKLGTQLENMQDKVNKNRQVKGERNWNALLTKEKVVEIVRRYNTGKYTQRELSNLFGISEMAVWEVLNKATWNHVTKNLCAVIHRQRAAKLSDKEVLDIIKKYRSGNYTQNELARAYELHEGSIFNILHGITWKSITCKEE